MLGSRSHGAARRWRDAQQLPARAGARTLRRGGTCRRRGTHLRRAHHRRGLLLGHRRARSVGPSRHHAGQHAAACPAPCRRGEDRRGTDLELCRPLRRRPVLLGFGRRGRQRPYLSAPAGSTAFRQLQRSRPAGIAPARSPWPARSTAGRAADVARPERVDGVTGAVSISVGHGGVCVVHGDGGVSCWGEENAAGQLGNGTRSPQPQPARVPGVTGAVAVTISVGSDRIGAHTCVAHEDASYSCWGGNRAGQLGDGTLTGRPYAAAVITPAAIPADRVPVDATDLLRTWVDGAVQARERQHPWLRAAWDHARDLTSAVPLENIEGIVQPVCDGPGEPPECRAESVRIAELRLEVAVHELAHVYDTTTGLASRRAWGAVQLYFGIRYPDCFRDQGSGPVRRFSPTPSRISPCRWRRSPTTRPGCPGLGDRPDRGGGGGRPVRVGGRGARLVHRQRHERRRTVGVAAARPVAEPRSEPGGRVRRALLHRLARLPA